MSGFLLQNATVLLQNAAAITKCDDFVTKCDVYYKLRQYKCFVKLIWQVLCLFSLSYENFNLISYSLNFDYQQISFSHCVEGVRIWSYSGAYFPTFPTFLRSVSDSVKTVREGFILNLKFKTLLSFKKHGSENYIKRYPNFQEKKIKTKNPDPTW